MITHPSITTACRGIPAQPPTTVAAVRSPHTDELRTLHLSGSPPRHTVRLPDEGVYILQQDLGLQIATPRCDGRACGGSEATCRCCRRSGDGPRDLGEEMADAADVARRWTPSHFAAWWWRCRRPCTDCLVAWLDLHAAADAARRLDMRLLHAPPALTRHTAAPASVGLSSACEGAYPHSADTYYSYTRTLSPLSPHPLAVGHHGDRLADPRPRRLCSHQPPDHREDSCPPHLFRWLLDGWQAFIDSGAHRDADRVEVLSNSCSSEPPLASPSSSSSSLSTDTFSTPLSSWCVFGHNHVWDWNDGDFPLLPTGAATTDKVPKGDDDSGDRDGALGRRGSSGASELGDEGARFEGVDSVGDTTDGHIENEYDFIEDLLEEEFAGLMGKQRTAELGGSRFKVSGEYGMPENGSEEDKIVEDEGEEDEGEEDEEPDDMPVPVIIPVADLSMAQALDCGFALGSELGETEGEKEKYEKKVNIELECH